MRPRSATFVWSWVRLPGPHFSVWILKFPIWLDFGFMLACAWLRWQSRAWHVQSLEPCWRSSKSQLALFRCFMGLDLPQFHPRQGLQSGVRWSTFFDHLWFSARGTNLHEIRRSLDEQCWPHNIQGFLAVFFCNAAVHVLAWRLAAEISLGRTSLASASRIGASDSSDVFQYLSSANWCMHWQQVYRLIDRSIYLSIYLIYSDLSLSLYFFLSFFLSFCLSFFLSFFLPSFLPFFLSFFDSFFFLSFYLFIFLSFYLSIFLFFFLSFFLPFFLSLIYIYMCVCVCNTSTCAWHSGVEQWVMRELMANCYGQIWLSKIWFLTIIFRWP